VVTGTTGMGKNMALGRVKNWLFVVAALAATPAAAVTYLFSVPREIVVVSINADSSFDIDYQITFANSPSADPIDIVDVGFPSSEYDLASVNADIGGQPCSGIKPSSYIKVGVEVPLGSNQIQPGETGTLHVHGVNPRMVYEDDKDKEYASAVFSPTWFGKEFTEGSPHLTMVVVFPPGVTGEQSRWHEAEGGQPTQMFIKDGRVNYAWDWPSASPSEQYFFGVSFPRSAVAEVRSRPHFQWLGNLIAALVHLATSYCGCIIPVAIFVGLAILGSTASRRRRMHYLSPKAKVEGVGIKRGLTAPEAALLLETPLNKVLTMVLFGLAKKGAVSVTSQTPLKLKKQPLPGNGLRPYESAFLAAIEDDGDLGEKELKKMLVDMIAEIEKKMKGFSHRETVAYYRSIVDTAWRLVATAATPEVKAEEFSNSLEWTMLDEKFDDRTREVFTGYVIPTPYWWGNFRPAPVTGGAGPVSFDMPTLPGANFASAIVGQVEGVAHNIVSKVESFTGGVTQVTNPPPVSSSSGGFHGGGSSGCACACACAGCACACAGGGR